MAILKIARMGHPILARRADPVPDPRSAEIRRLIADMIETMEDADGTGLAGALAGLGPGQRAERVGSLV